MTAKSLLFLEFHLKSPTEALSALFADFRDLKCLRFLQRDINSTHNGVVKAGICVVLGGDAITAPAEVSAAGPKVSGVSPESIHCRIETYHCSPKKVSLQRPTLRLLHLEPTAARS